MVPEGATITTITGPLDGLRMIDVIWESKTVTMFTVDVEERATVIGKVRVKSKKKPTT